MAESFPPLSRTAESEVVSGPRSVARRTVLTSAALAVPAIHLVAVSPAFAASGGRVNTLTAQSGSMPASGGVTLTATVVDSTGAPMSGQAVSFTGPSGATFSPSFTTTDSAGAASTTADLQDQWAKPGATTTVTATASGDSLSRSFTVLGANALGFGAFFGNTPMQTRFEFPSPVVQITGGGNWDTTGNTYFVALLQDGQVWTYGANAKGQLGDGTTTDRYAWGPVVGLSDVTQIALGAESVTALTSDGAVTKWGDDPYRATTVPTPLDGLTGVTQIACGRATVFALLSDGSVKAWGSGQSGAAGIGGGWPGTTPMQVTGLTAGVTQIAAGALSGYALMTDGTVRAWGWNGYGQLGDGSTTDRDSPVAVSTLTGTASQITATALGMFVLRSDGSVVGCGYNGDGGELGNGTTSPTANPALAPVSGLSSGTRTISGGGYTVYALMTDGSVRAWGSNSSGQRGDGTTTASAVPQNVAVTIPNNRKIVAVAAPSVGSLTGFVIVDTP